MGETENTQTAKFTSILPVIISEVEKSGIAVSPIIRTALKNKAAMYWLFYKNWQMAVAAGTRSSGGTMNTALKGMLDTEESILELCYKAEILKLGEQMTEQVVRHNIEIIERKADAGTDSKP